MAKKIFVVTHPKLYMKIDGKMESVAVGTEFPMDEKKASSLLKQGKILVKGQGKKVEVGTKEEAKSEDDKSETKAA